VRAVFVKKVSFGRVSVVSFVIEVVTYPAQ
jgi:hypothetical protein